MRGGDKKCAVNYMYLLHYSRWGGGGGEGGERSVLETIYYSGWQEILLLLPIPICQCHFLYFLGENINFHQCQRMLKKGGGG